MKQSTILLLFISCLVLACSKEITKYKELLDEKEIIYPGLTSNFKAYQGNLRVKLQWNPSPDPSINKYVIYWNNNSDSLVLKATSNNTSDTISAMASGVSEYVQNFILYTFDNKGNRSIGQSLSGVRIYGPLYLSTLTNRPVNATKPPVAMGANFKVYFSKADTVLNTNTVLSYVDGQLQPQTINLKAKADSAILNLAPVGTKVAIRSSYVPVRNGVDTFTVTYSDTLLLK